MTYVPISQQLLRDMRVQQSIDQIIWRELHESMRDTFNGPRFGPPVPPLYGPPAPDYCLECGTESPGYRRDVVPPHFAAQELR